MKRRIDLEPTRELVDNALTDDIAGRKGELIEFVRLIDSIEGNFSIFLDGEWGSGKTFFVKEAERILNLSNPNLMVEIPDEGRAGLCESIQDCAMSNPHLPIYFNAWEYDYFDNPIVPLMETVITEFHDLAGMEEEGKPIREKVVGLLKALNLSFGCNGFGVEVDFEKAISAFETNSPFDELCGKREIRNRLKDLLDAAKQERGNRIVLFVDELDRCRPEYAVKTLEALKFLFDQDYLTMVFSVNARALGSAVSHWYGGGFDGSRYLMRFYDAIFRLKDSDIWPYLSNLGFECHSPDDFVLRYARRKEVTFRDINRWMEAVKDVSLSEDYMTCESSQAAIVCMRIIVPGAIIFSTIYPEKRSSLYGGSDSVSFRDWLLEDPLHVENVLHISGEYFDQEKERSKRPVSDPYSDDRLSEAAYRLDVLCGIIFGEEEEMGLSRIGSVYVTQLRKAARRALGL